MSSTSYENDQSKPICIRCGYKPPIGDFALHATEPRIVAPCRRCIRWVSPNESESDLKAFWKEISDLSEIIHTLNDFLKQFEDINPYDDDDDEKIHDLYIQVKKHIPEKWQIGTWEGVYEYRDSLMKKIAEIILGRG